MLRVLWYDNDLDSPQWLGDLTRYADSLSFSTKVHGGFDSLQVTLNRDWEWGWRWLRDYFHHRLVVVDDTHRVCWEGRVYQAVPNPKGVTLLAEGYGIGATQDKVVSPALQSTGWLTFSKHGGPSAPHAFGTWPLYAQTSNDQYASSHSTMDVNGAWRKYYGWNANVPGNAKIVGIRVTIEWHVNISDADGSLSVDLSWDGGNNWTRAHYDSEIGLTDHTTVFGGETDLWGHSWTPDEINSDNFQVRLTISNKHDPPDYNIYYLDWISVQIYYLEYKKVSDLIIDALNDACPDLSDDHTHITTNTLQTLQSWTGEEHPLDIITRLCSLGDSTADAPYLFAVWEDRVPYYWKADLTTPNWRLPREATWVQPDLGISLREVYTRVKLKFIDLSDPESTETVWYSDYSGVLGNKSREWILSLAESECGAAAKAAQAWLHDHVNPRYVLAIQVRDWIEDRFGKRYPAWWVRAGDVLSLTPLIPIGSLPAGELENTLIRGTTWSNGTLVIIPDVTPDQAEIIMSQLEGQWT